MCSPDWALKTTPSNPRNNSLLQPLAALRRLKRMTSERATCLRTASDELLRAARIENGLVQLAAAVAATTPPATLTSILTAVKTTTTTTSRWPRDPIAEFEAAVRAGHLDYCADAAGNNLSASEQYCSLVGRDMRDTEWTRAVHPDDLPSVLEQYETVIAGRVRSTEFLLRMKVRSGKFERLRAEVTLHYDEATGMYLGSTGMILPHD